MFKPMLAATLERAEDLRFPVLASPKLDGIRATVQGGVVLSRSLKPIPNQHVQLLLGSRRFENLDGELIVGDPTDNGCYRRTTSGIMSEDGKPSFTYHVFDRFGPAGFDVRLHEARGVRSSMINVVEHQLIEDLDELTEYEQRIVGAGYEGVMLRDPDGWYKQGRSTMREQGLVKLKRFAEDEAVVLGAEELMHNANEAKTNELGYKERSSRRSGLVGAGKLGALHVRGLTGKFKGCEFYIGTGFNDETRRRLWEQRHNLAGHIAAYKYFETGTKDAPRFPVFKWFRSKIDMS